MEKEFYKDITEGHPGAILYLGFLFGTGASVAVGLVYAFLRGILSLF